MSATEVFSEIEKLPAREQEEVFALLASKIIARKNPGPKPWLGKKMNFNEACEVVFRENHELLSLLAK